MGITLTGISNDMLSTTIYDIEDEVSEALFQTTPFLSVSRKLKKVKEFNGGFKIVVPVEVDESSVETVLTSGWEALNMSVKDATDQAEYDWLRVAMPVLISGREEAMNSGDKAIIDLAEVRFKNSLSALMRKVNKEIVSGRTTNLGALGTLNGTGEGRITGFLQNQALGSQSNDMGGLARASIVGLNNQYKLGTGHFDTNGMTSMYELEALASTVSPSGGDGGRFHLTLASTAAYTLYRNALFSKERYIDAKTLDSAGVQSLAFSSGVIMPEREMYVGGAAATKTSMMMLNLDGIQMHIHKDADFSFTGFENVTGYDGRYGKVLFMGGLVANHLGSSALLTNNEVA
tara:strand:- start:394 stop:1431 length:1038 start_codon:yes stop_codon:yes gene_type:complete